MQTIQEHFDQINKILYDLHFNPDFEVSDVDNSEPLSEKKIAQISQGTIDTAHLKPFYSVTDGFQYKWTHLKSGINGSLNIQPLNDVFQDQWQDMVTDVKGKAEIVEDFRVFDFFSNQIYVGLFLNSYPKSKLYYVRELEAYPLYLDIENYFKLSVVCLGLINWPSLLVKWDRGIELVEAKNMEEKLVTTAPGFNLNEFKTLYEKWRVKD